MISFRLLAGSNLAKKQLDKDLFSLSITRLVSYITSCT